VKVWVIGPPAAVPSETVALAVPSTGRQYRVAVKDKPHPSVKLADTGGDERASVGREHPVFRLDRLFHNYNV
jgi:hypothetical protein